MQIENRYKKLINPVYFQNDKSYVFILHAIKVKYYIKITRKTDKIKKLR